MLGRERVYCEEDVSRGGVDTGRYEIDHRVLIRCINRRVMSTYKTK